MDEEALRAQIAGISKQIQELETEAMRSGNAALHAAIGRKQHIVKQLQRDLQQVMKSNDICDGCTI